ncbi:protein of unknown function [Methylococcus capsulatus]|uniref:Uncharacterized protein n=1 Tax=Methylococcus capsulatus TaxID=414 RepID=A0AA35URS7_METCP|nr:protein of unknown function [Methylococcus capsulatus]
MYREYFPNVAERTESVRSVRRAARHRFAGHREWAGRRSGRIYGMMQGFSHKTVGVIHAHHVAGKPWVW